MQIQPSQIAKLNEGKFPKSISVLKGIKIEDPLLGYSIKFYENVNKGDVNGAENAMQDANKAGLCLKITEDMYKQMLSVCVEEGRFCAANSIIYSASRAGFELKFSEEQYKTVLIAAIKKNWKEVVREIVECAIKEKLNDDEFFANALEFFMQNEKTDQVSKIIEYLAN